MRLYDELLNAVSLNPEQQKIREILETKLKPALSTGVEDWTEDDEANLTSLLGSLGLDEEADRLRAYYARKRGGTNSARGRLCDIVMKGGITSGIVYPAAVREIAKAFNFKNMEEHRLGQLRHPLLRRPRGCGRATVALTGLIASGQSHNGWQKRTDSFDCSSRPGARDRCFALSSVSLAAPASNLLGCLSGAGSHGHFQLLQYSEL